MKTVLFGAIVLLAGCAAQPRDVTPAGERECFYISEIDYWSAIDDSHLFIRGRGEDEEYLVTLTSFCPEIGLANAIAFTNFTRRLCPGDLGKVSYRRPGLGLRTCLIDDIERVTGREAAKTLVEERRRR